MMKITVTRNSVCAADDFNPPHKKIFRFDEKESLKQLLKLLMTDYLPKISGGKATWVAQTSIPVAVMAQEWKEPALLHPDTYITEVFKEGSIAQIHFEYCAQENPIFVFQKMKEQRI